MLEILRKENTWNPPELTREELLGILRDRIQFLEHRQDYWVVFQVLPYPDCIYAHYEEGSMGDPSVVRRYTFHEGYCWSEKQERYFEKHCLNNPYCAVDYCSMDEIFDTYSKQYPQWHLQRYYTKPFRLLDHIYHCLKQGTVKEMLYKSGLDELAQQVYELDDINLLSRKPAEIYDGLSMRTLRALNCSDGAKLLREQSTRSFLLELQKHYPDIFRSKMNDAQCRYLKRLIDGELTVGEAGRLYLARSKDLLVIWNLSQYEMILEHEQHEKELEEKITALEALDPIYREYFGPTSKYDEDEWMKERRAAELEYYLFVERESYNRAIRRSNRKRSDELQERNNGYVVRLPQTINDFCREAVYMRNCLMSYLEAYINNDTTILFLRKTDAVNTPFITMEVFQNELKQAYHRFNIDCTPEEAKWIRKYCDRHEIDYGHFTFGEGVDDLF